MPEYIDKSVVLDQISKQKLFYEEERKQSGDCLEEMNCVGAENGLTALEDIISDIPAADVAPVVHGKWLNFYGDFTCAECSKCGAIYDVVDVKPSGEIFGEFEKEYKFCPNCGAKVDLEEDE